MSERALPSERGPTAWLAARVKVDAPGQATPAVAWVVRRLFGPLLRLLWPARVRGWERLPLDRPCLVVANHSGTGVIDVLCLALHALERQPRPRLAGMAHPVAFYVPIVGHLLRGLGAIPSTYAHARAALEQGASVLVYPGGDHEAFRPIWQAGRVDFNGRQGFLRLARGAWVPIVPLGYWGTHFTQPILWRSGLLAWLAILPRAVGLKRLPITLPWLAGVIGIGSNLGPVHPLLAALLAVAWTAFPLIHFLPWVPWPVRLTIGAPIPPEELFGARGADGPLDAASARVVGAVQAAVDESRSA